MTMADNAVALGIQTPDSFKNIGSMLNAANAAQDFQRVRIALEKERALLQPQIEQGQAQAQTAKIGAAAAAFKLKGDQASAAMKIIGGMSQDPRITNAEVDPATGIATQKGFHGVVNALTESRDQMIASGVPKEQAEFQMSHALAQAHDPGAVLNMIRNKIRQNASAGEQYGVLSAPLTPLSTGGSINPTQLQPGAPGAVSAPIPTTLPPTTEVVGPNGERRLLGPQGGGRGTGVATSLPVGKPEAIAGTVDAMNKDFETTRQVAQNASQDIGVLQNIKKYAHGAITGVESDRRAYLEGLSGLTGIDSAQLAKTSTDLLAKNSNMLALVGGNTDAARILAEGANPNTHMTPEAIEKAADQVIAQRKLALAKQKYMQPFKALNDPTSYMKALTEFNQHADPRILQLGSMSKEDKIKMKAAMTPQERQEFGQHIRRLHELGVLGE